MGRPKRVDVGGYVYHVLNRGNGRMTIFDDEGDYEAFERILEESLERESGVGLLSYCLMPNHWHLVVRTSRDGELSRFVRWLTLTHTQRWHAHRHTVGGRARLPGAFQVFPRRIGRLSGGGVPVRRAQRVTGQLGDSSGSVALVEPVALAHGNR